MKRRHFETLRPVCPLCRVRTGQSVPLRIGLEVRGDDNELHEGALHCTNSECQCEYPVLDGVPLLVPQIRDYIGGNIHHLTARDDFSDETEGLLGDGCGPGSAFDATRLHLSSYAWDHYGDLDPAEPVGEPRPGSVVRVLEQGLATTGTLQTGPVLDVGCSVGRAAFELARRTDGLVLGVDVNFAMLRLAAGVLCRGVVRYPRRRVGLVYDRREFPVQFENAATVDFWACDATALPFTDCTFAAAVGLNVLDCVASPLDLLGSMGRVLRPDAPLVLCTPYDWSGAATPPEAWIGGHSQRGATRGAAEPVLRALLTPGAHPASVAGLRLEAEINDLPWHVRLHDRGTMAYRTHLVVARAAAGQ